MRTRTIELRIMAAVLTVLWSLGGAFARLFDSPLLGMNEPHLTSLQRATGRALFAGLVGSLADVLSSSECRRPRR